MLSRGDGTMDTATFLHLLHEDLGLTKQTARKHLIHFTSKTDYLRLQIRAPPNDV